MATTSPVSSTFALKTIPNVPWPTTFSAS